MTSCPLSILLVEDNSVDVIAFRRALRCFQDNEISLTVAGNGKEALDLLRAEQPLASPAMPVVIFLDINMPVMNGHEFLEELRSDKQLSHHVVIVLTTSDDPNDVQHAYSKQVAGYLVKGDTYHTLPKLIAIYQDAMEFPLTK